MNVGVYGHIKIGEDGRVFLYVGSATNWRGTGAGLSGRRKGHERAIENGDVSHHYNAWREKTVK
jgi:hypothetical protein